MISSVAVSHFCSEFKGSEEDRYAIELIASMDESGAISPKINILSNESYFETLSHIAKKDNSKLG